MCSDLTCRFLGRLSSAFDALDAMPGIQGPKCEAAHIKPLPNGLFPDFGQHRCVMEARLDAVTITCAVCVAAYAALAAEYVAQYAFGVSLEIIRGTSLLIAVVMATVIALDFFGKKRIKAK